MTTADTSATLSRVDIVGPLLARATGDAGWRDTRPELIAGGKSNLTYLLSSSAGELIFRRPPNGTLLPTAHDMGREARVQRALARTGVPVAEVVLFDDGAAIGVPFYVMRKVPGVVIRDILPTNYAEGDCHRIGLSLIDTLARLHNVDPVAIGLADYGRPIGFVERQLLRWGRQWDVSQQQAVPQVDELAEQLRRSVPTTQATGIVHGDYRLDNCVIDPAGREIAAVLDWELSTLGDPLTDLGMLLFYWRDAARVIPALVPCVTDHAGFPAPQELVQRWTAQTGLDADDIGWYRAFAHLKFAVIAAGVGQRVRADAMGGQDFGNLAEQIVATAESGLDLFST